MPEWQTAFESLQRANDYQSISLFLLLFILARRAENVEVSQLIDNNLLSHFRSIVQSDIKKIEQLAPGVASALIWWGKRYQNFKLELGAEDFYLLADFFESTSDYSQYMNFDIKSEINNLLSAYINVTNSNFKAQNNIKLLAFNHDTLAEEGVAHAVLDKGDPNSHLQQAKVLNYAVEKLSDGVASLLLAHQLRKKDFFKDKQTKIALINKLNNRGCTFDNHLTYLIFGYDLSPEERKKNAIALLKMNEDKSLNHQLVCNCLTVLQKHAPEEAKQAAITLLEKNDDEPLEKEILCNCLTILQQHEPKKAIQAAITLLKKNEDDPLGHAIVSNSLTILQQNSHEKAKQAAITLLKKNDDEPLEKEILCNCLTILQQYAPEEAKKAAVILLLKNDDNPLSHQIICNCLTILQQHEPQKAKQAAIILLSKNDDELLNKEIICNCLTILQEYAPKEAKQAAITLLKKNENAPLDTSILCNCLTIFQLHAPEKAKPVAITILKKNDDEPLGHQIISKCLSVLQKHAPKEAKKTAITLLKKNENEILNHQIICKCLSILQEHAPKEAKKTAITLLKRNKHEPLNDQTICNCLSVLQEHAPEEALQAAILLLQEKEWQQLNWNVVYRCLKSFTLFELDNPIVTEIISEYNGAPNINISKDRYINILGLPFLSNNLWCNAIREEMISWQGESRRRIINILFSLKNSPKKTMPTCKVILQRWRIEVRYQLKRNKTIPFWQHINLSINHPLLRKLAIQTAKDMIVYDQQNPDVLPEPLLESCRDLLT